MPSNREWLNNLAANDPQKLNVWVEAEHVDDNDEISKLKAERDELKAKVEGFTEALEKLGCSVLANGTVFEPAGGQSKVRVGQSNLEWLVENDRDGLVLAMCCDEPGRADCSDCAAWKETNSCLFKREWLMAPHSDPLSDSESSQRVSESDQREQERACESYMKLVDAQRDRNGTCLDGDETCPNHSKAQSKTETSLSDLYGILSDEKVPETPDFAENPQKTPEQRQKDDALDSREKLRKDIINCVLDSYSECWLIDVDTIDEWLDRQAEITAKRLCADCTPNVAEERDYLRTRVDELNTQVQEQSELIAARGKTIESLERFMSERKLKLKKQLESKTEQYRKLKAERDEYRELYEAAMSTDYGQLSKEHEQFREEISEMLGAAQQIERIRAKHETQLN